MFNDIEQLADWASSLDYNVFGEIFMFFSYFTEWLSSGSSIDEMGVGL